MIQKQVSVARIQTMADGSVRVIIDLINGNGEDMKDLYALQSEETTMIIAPTQAIQELNEDDVNP